MNVGVMGLGKLGLPIALCLDLRGHKVMGYDLNPDLMQKDTCSYREQGPQGEPSLDPFLKASNLTFGSLADVVQHSEIVFVVVQTPHEKKFEGITPLPDDRTDFDYTWLMNAVAAISEEIKQARKETVIVVVSTVLPGTVRKKLVPLINEWVRLCYNPAFIAMGTAMRDFLEPEFVLFGVWDEVAAKKAEELYRTLHSHPFYKTSVENAELIKMAYNTFISMKITFANTLMEICHKLDGTDIDAVTDGLKLATDRVVSGKYLSGGMGDGGGCHPRDNIALSWLARELGLSYDMFESIMIAREHQAEWLTQLMCQHDLPKVILGRSYKPESAIELGSPALLCKNLLESNGHSVDTYDPYIDSAQPDFGPSVFLIGTKHGDFTSFPFPKGSVVIDPWRFVPDTKGVQVIRVGEGIALRD